MFSIVVTITAMATHASPELYDDLEGKVVRAPQPRVQGRPALLFVVGG